MSGGDGQAAPRHPLLSRSDRRLVRHRERPRIVGERITECRRLLDLATAQSDVTLALLARRLLVVALLEMGDFDAADRQIDAYAQTAGKLRLPSTPGRCRSGEACAR